MKFFGFIDIHSEYKGVSLTKVQAHKLEEAHTTQTPIKWKGKKVLVTSFDLEIIQDNVIINIDMEEYNVK